MPLYQAPLKQAMFLLRDVLAFESHRELPGFGDLTPDLLEAILTEAAKLAEQVLLPLNRIGDTEGCRRMADGSVVTPAGFREAYEAYVEGGWPGLAAPVRFGGQGLPYVLAALVNEFCTSANMAFTMYAGLSQGALAALMQHGTAAQIARFAPEMTSGRWTGAMNLTEPQCGTDLGLIRTKAVPQADGALAITGQKIFISAGEHDLAENIVHLVLARIEGAPEGTRGLSLFIVPKYIVGADGRAGARNALSCGSIEHKMGIHGNATCVMNYDGARGELLGEAGKGLAAMFVMMNEARIGVAIQGLGLSEVAYQNALAYARQRRQGRALTGASEPHEAADLLLVHPDVRLNLLRIKAFNEAARGLVLWTALQSDIAHRSPDAAAREAAEDILGLMTPVLKALLTERGFENCVAAQQLFGGHGYIAEWGMEQFVRDARITMIYEGANAIQALDLVGRKLGAHGGRALTRLFSEVSAFMVEAGRDETLRPLLADMAKGLGHVQQASLWLMQNAPARPDHAGAGAMDYLRMFGIVALGYMWLRILVAAKAGSAEDAGQLAAKLATARFFFQHMMPETALCLARLTAGSDVVMAPGAQMF